MDKNKALETILLHRLVAIVRLREGSQVAEVLECLVLGGIRVLEITANTPGYLHAIAAARRQYPDVLIGAGTVTDQHIAQEALAAGAQFLVTPHTEAGIVSLAHQQQVPILMGALTPTEIGTALGAGADIIKLFPAGCFGPAYFKAIRAPYDQVPFFPVGGIGPENLRSWIKMGAAGVGVGGALAQPILNVADRERCIAGARELIGLLANP